MLGPLRRTIGAALDRRTRAVNARIEALGASTAQLEHATAAGNAELFAIRAELAEIRANQDRAETVLRWLVQGHAEHRRELLDARAQASYAAVFEDPQPLVSIVIPTYDHTELLLARSLPSVLAQTYERLEIIVVGDAVPEAVGDAVAAIGDDRLRFVHLPYRVPAPDRARQWMAGSVAPRLAGRDLATGSWLVDFDDDDMLRPQAIERGLALAREHRLECVYGPCLQHLPDGTTEILSAFPPEYGKFPVQGALLHRGLRFFERTAVSAAFGVPNDWFLAVAMLQAGVRFGMQDEVVLDYYPSMRGSA